MPRKGEKLSAEQLAKMRAGREKNKNTPTQNPTNSQEPINTAKYEVQDAPTEAGTELSVEQLTKMVLELQKQNAAFMAGAASVPQQVQQAPSMRGTTTLFSSDLSVYQDPRPRLMAEPRLQRIAFSNNYELEYNVALTNSYEKKDGTMERQPKFDVTLNGIILDDSGEDTGKRFIARRMVFFEDPDTAINIAERNGITVDDFGGEQEFLNAMRYLRLRDWLFEFFWKPKPDADKSNFRDEVIAGQVVRTFQKSVPAEQGVRIDYDGLGGSKLRT